MEFKKDENIVIENAKILFPNFAGVVSPNNRSGERNFVVIIPDSQMAEKMFKDGWNIKRFKQRDPDEIPDYYLPVALRYDFFPPRVNVRTRSSRFLEWGEDQIHDLDQIEMETVDMEIRPYRYDINGKEGIKAYLKNMYVTIKEDRLAEKYANVGLDDEEALPFK